MALKRYNKREKGVGERQRGREGRERRGWVERREIIEQ